MGLLNMIAGHNAPSGNRATGLNSRYNSSAFNSQGMAALQQSNPALFDALQQLMANQVQPQEQPDFGGFNNVIDMIDGGGPGASGSTFSGGFRGYSNIKDMFDGGGMGKSGDKFEGGGKLSAIGNLFRGRK
ncbi:hypothetical protein [Sulfitobacter sp. 1A15299]|uniref:hypothetical protein n=1 Tax=Sulfitobacter sp. 1A15299 TaxID=3368598 RepID=UPI0037464DB7